MSTRSEGELESMTAALLEHSKELPDVHRHAFTEKTFAQVVEMYYCSGVWSKYIAKTPQAQRKLEAPPPQPRKKSK